MKSNLAKMKTVLRNTMLFGLVVVLTLGFVFPNPEALTAFAADEPVVTTDTPTIYDISDLTGKESITYQDGVKWGSVESSENVGFRFDLKFNQSTRENGVVVLNFLSSDEGGWGLDEYVFKFEWGVDLYVRNQWDSTRVANGGPASFNPTGTYNVLITFANYYENDVRTGTQITCVVDGETAFTYVDKADGYATMGKNLVWNEYDAWSAYTGGQVTLADCKPEVRTDEPTIYDISDLTGGKEEIAYQDGVKWGSVESSENVGFQFDLKFNQSTRENGVVVLNFLSSDEGGWGLDEYVFKFEWGIDLYVRNQWDSTRVANGGPASFSPTGTYNVLITFANYYENDVRTGTQITCVVDGETAFTYVDKADGYATMGKNLVWNEYDAWNAYTGGQVTLADCKPEVHTDEPTIYDISDLTGGKEEITYQDGVKWGSAENSENVGFRFDLKFNQSTRENGVVVLNFLSSDEGGWGLDEYVFKFEWGIDLYVRNQWDSTRVANGGPASFSPTGTYNVLITFANYYENDVRTGTQITCVVDGETAFTYVDKADGYATMGKNLVWNEYDAWSAYTGGQVTLADCKPEVRTDEPTIYDIYDLTGEESVTYASTASTAKIAEFPDEDEDGKVENVGLKFKMELNQSFKDRGRVPIDFLSVDEGGWGSDSYNFLYEWSTNLYVRQNWSDSGSTVVATGGSAFNPTGTYEILVTFVNYYEDDVRKGTKISCSVDGTEVISYVDTAEGYANMGKYIVWNEDYKDCIQDGKVTLKSCKYRYDEPRIYNLYELTGTESVTYASTASTAKIAEFPDEDEDGKVENVGLKFKMKLNQSFPDRGRVPIDFLSVDEGGWGTDSYNFLYEWSTNLYVRQNWSAEGSTAGATGGSAFSPTGTYEILVTFVNYYEDDVHKGTKISCSVDGTEVISYVDTAEGYANMGKYIVWNEDYKDYIQDGKVTLSDVRTATVSGTVLSYGSDTDNVTVQLLKDGVSEPAYSTKITGNNEEYSFQNVKLGNYTMVVTKNDHVTETYAVTVNSETITSEAVTLYLLGDINTDGSRNKDDLALLRKGLVRPSNVTEILFARYDVNKDGMFNVKDLVRLKIKVGN